MRVRLRYSYLKPNRFRPTYLSAQENSVRSPHALDAHTGDRSIGKRMKLLTIRDAKYREATAAIQSAIRAVAAAMELDTDASETDPACSALDELDSAFERISGIRARTWDPKDEVLS
jgi:hypothetical protein